MLEILFRQQPKAQRFSTPCRQDNEDVFAFDKAFHSAYLLLMKTSVAELFASSKYNRFQVSPFVTECYYMYNEDNYLSGIYDVRVLFCDVKGALQSDCTPKIWRTRHDSVEAFVQTLYSRSGDVIHPQL